VSINNVFSVIIVSGITQVAISIIFILYFIFSTKRKDIVGWLGSIFFCSGILQFIVGLIGACILNGS